jgi:hypothetical protein
LYFLCTSSLLVSFSWLSCILPFCRYLQHTTQTSMPPEGFEPAIPPNDQPQIHALDGSATGIGTVELCQRLFTPLATFLIWSQIPALAPSLEMFSSIS